MESTILKSKLFVKNEKSAARRTSTPEGMTLRARGGDDASESTGGGGGGGTGGGGGDKKDTKIDIPLPQYMHPAAEKFADKRVKVSGNVCFSVIFPL